MLDQVGGQEACDAVVRKELEPGGQHAQQPGQNEVSGKARLLRCRGDWSCPALEPDLRLRGMASHPERKQDREAGNQEGHPPTDKRSDVASDQSSQNDAQVDAAIKKRAVESAALPVDRLRHQRLPNAVLTADAKRGDSGENEQNLVVWNGGASHGAERKDQDRVDQDPLATDAVRKEPEEDAADGHEQQLNGEEQSHLRGAELELRCDRDGKDRHQEDFVVVEYPADQRPQEGTALRGVKAPRWHGCGTGH